MKNSKDSKTMMYYYYFFPEIKSFLSKTEKNKIEKELFDLDQNIFQNFEEKRQLGENESYICTLIRNDSVEEFISFVNRANLSLSNAQIKHSIFETNSFLIENNETTLIEYSAFFGSIQIFQYLRMNNVELTPSLWLYAIHSNNPDLIHLLEEYHVEPKNKSFEECLKEAIKCHHNDVARYIQDNLLIGKVDESKILSSIFAYYNYCFFPKSLGGKFTLHYLCQYNHYTLVKLLLESNELDINSEIVLYINNKFI